MSPNQILDFLHMFIFFTFMTLPHSLMGIIASTPFIRAHAAPANAPLCGCLIALLAGFVWLMLFPLGEFYQAEYVLVLLPFVSIAVLISFLRALPPIHQAAAGSLTVSATFSVWCAWEFFVTLHYESWGVVIHWLLLSVPNAWLTLRLVRSAERIRENGNSANSSIEVIDSSIARLIMLCIGISALTMLVIEVNDYILSIDRGYYLWCKYRGYC